MRLAPSARAAVIAVLAAGGAAVAQGAASPCALHGPQATAAKATCLACHGPGGSAATATREHVVDLDYAEVAANRPNDFRPVEEVLRRGVRLPDGALRCATCHDTASPYAAHVALPRGAPAVESWSPAQERDDGTSAAGPAQEGQPVSAKPLCLACHLYD